MASSVGSGFLTCAGLLGIGGGVLLLIRHYLPLRSTPAFLTVPVFLAITLPFSAILLFPIDLASSANTQGEAPKGVSLPERAVLVSWRITYWLTFVLTWFVLPFLGDYMDAGYRDTKSSALYSLRANARYQLVVLSCAVAGLIYMIFSYGFDFTAIKGLIMALAYVWGLVLAIYLMGHGLVAIPRRLLRNADTSDHLRRVQTQAPRIHEKLEDATIALEEIEAQVGQLKRRKTGSAREFQTWIDELAELTGSSPPRVTLATPDLNAPAKIPAVITERYLADLSRRFTRARHQKIRYVEEWDQVVHTASRLQAILDAQPSRALVFPHSTSGTSPLDRWSPMTPYTRYALHVHVVPASRMVLGSFLSLASAAVVWSEVIRFPAPHLSAVSLTVIHRPNDDDYQIGFGGQVLSAAWICYMCACTLSSITVVPVWNQRALVRRKTYPESACWYAGQIARLTVPLVYNFLTFLPVKIHEKTTFYHFLGRLINLTPLGTWLDYLFPVFVLLPVCATLFNLYGRIKTVFGFGILDDDDEEDDPAGLGTGGWREGRDLIARDLSGPGAQASIGLMSSPRPSADAAHSPRPASPARHVTGPVSQSSRPRRDRGPPSLDPETEEESFLALFGRRVKNTFQTIDTPRWMQGGEQASSRGGDGPFPGLGRPGRTGTGGESGRDGGSLFDRLFNQNQNGGGDRRANDNRVARNDVGIGSGRILL